VGGNFGFAILDFGLAGQKSYSPEPRLTWNAGSPGLHRVSELFIPTPSASGRAKKQITIDPPICKLTKVQTSRTGTLRRDFIFPGWRVA
jgi:hypothetical protein